MSIQFTKQLKTALKVVVTFCVLGYLVWLVNTKKDEYNALFSVLLKSDNTLFLTLVVALVAVNWLFEAFKWKILTKPIEELSVAKAYQSVLIGLSMGLITPRSVGDFIGRLLIIKSDKKYGLLGSLLLSRVSQMLATLVFGLAGTAFFFMHYDAQIPFKLPLSIVVLVVIIGLFYFRNQLLKFVFNTKLGFKLKKYLVIIRSYNLNQLWEVFGWSLARYIVFSLQYFLLLRILGVTIPVVELLLLIAITFLAKSMMISVNFIADMGVRQITAATIMGVADISESVAVMGSFGVWGINIVLPAIVGVFFLIKVKWRLG